MATDTDTDYLIEVILETAECGLRDSTPELDPHAEMPANPLGRLVNARVALRTIVHCIAIKLERDKEEAAKEEAEAEATAADATKPKNMNFEANTLLVAIFLMLVILAISALSGWLLADGV